MLYSGPVTTTLTALPRNLRALSVGYVVEVVVRWFPCCVPDPSSVTEIQLASLSSVTITSNTHYKLGARRGT